MTEDVRGCPCNHGNHVRVGVREGGLIDWVEDVLCCCLVGRASRNTTPLALFPSSALLSFFVVEKGALVVLAYLCVGVGVSPNAATGA